MERRLLKYITIIVAGETIFMLPFLIPRIYRPLILEAWNLSNTQIGAAFFAYGITATLSYLLGGPIADKYHPRLLMATSLIMTGLAGACLPFFHSPTAFVLIYTFFGISTTLLMWGSLIRTTHIIGGELHRSAALGLLDGGRGLTAALITSLLVLLISIFFSGLQQPYQQLRAVKMIYWITSGFCLILAAALWFSLKGLKMGEADDRDRWTLSETLTSLKNPKIWLLSLVILSAYCGYKSIDNYSIYLVDVYHRDLRTTSALTTVIFWLRPVSTIACGFIADYLHQKNHRARFFVLFILLTLSAITQIFLAMMNASHFIYAISSIFLCASFVYGLRAIYFSIFGDLHIPTHLVGTTKCIVSFVGFLPDVFFGIVTGSLIDQHPGILGYQYTFLFTGVFLAVGTFASFQLYQKS